MRTQDYMLALTIKERADLEWLSTMPLEDAAIEVKEALPLPLTTVEDIMVALRVALPQNREWQRQAEEATFRRLSVSPPKGW
jgi:hypothetical protein